MNKRFYYESEGEKLSLSASVVAHSLCRDSCVDWEIILTVDENPIFPDAI